MTNRMLSNHELIARFRNRCEEKGLEDKLSKITKTLYSSKDSIKGEIQTWRHFVQKTSRNSGWSPKSLRPEIGEDILTPNSVSSRSPQLPGVSGAKDNSKLQRPWAYTYTDASHNKVYRELHQAGANAQKNLALRAQIMSPQPPPIGRPLEATPGPQDEVHVGWHPKLATEVCQVKGVIKARSAWGRMPKLLAAKTSDVADHSSDGGLVSSEESGNSKIRSTWNRGLARQVSKMQMVNQTKAAWLTIGRGKGQSSTLDTTCVEPGDNCDLSKKQSDGKFKLVRNVSKVIEMKKSLDAFCSECKSNKNLGDEETKMSRVALSYSGLQRVKSVLTMRKGKAGAGTVGEQVKVGHWEAEEEAKPRKRRCSCKCRKLRKPVSEFWTMSGPNPKPPAVPRRRVVSTGSDPKDKSPIKGKQKPESSTSDKIGSEKGEKEKIRHLRIKAKSLSLDDKKGSAISPTESQITHEKDKEKGGKTVPANTQLHDTASNDSKEINDNITIEKLRRVLRMNGIEESDAVKNESEASKNEGQNLDAKGCKEKEKSINERGGQVVRDVKASTTSQNLSNDKVSDLRNQNERDQSVKPCRQRNFPRKGDKKLVINPNGTHHTTKVMAPCPKSITNHNGEVIDQTSVGDSCPVDMTESNIDTATTISNSIQPLEPPYTNTTSAEDQINSDVVLSANDDEENAPTQPKDRSDDDRDISNKPSDTSCQKATRNIHSIQRQSSVSSTHSDHSERRSSTSGGRYSLNRRLINVHRASSVIKYSNSFLRFEMGRKHSIKPSHQVVKGDDVFTRIAKVLLHQVKLLRRFRAAQASAGHKTSSNSGSNKGQHWPGTSLSRQGSVTSSDEATDQNKSSRYSPRKSIDQTSFRPFTDLQSIQESGENSAASRDPKSFSPNQNKFHNTRWGKAVSKANIIESMLPGIGSSNTNNNNNNNVGNNNNSNNINNSIINNDNNNNTNCSDSCDRKNDTDSKTNDNEQRERNENAENKTTSNSKNGKLIRDEDNSTKLNKNCSDKKNNDDDNNNSSSNNRFPGINDQKAARGLRRHNLADGHKSAIYHRGIRLVNYVTPQHRYKTAADRGKKTSKRGLSIRWHSAVGAMVNTHQTGAGSQSVGSVFSKDARQRALSKMVEENHAKADEDEPEVISHSLKVRIEQFMVSVEPFCQGKSNFYRI